MATKRTPKLNGKSNKPRKPATTPDNVPAIDAAAKPAPTTFTGRRAVTFAECKYPYGKPSTYDDEYLAFYASLGATDKAGISLVEHKRKIARNPFYSGNASAATDNLGYVNRLRNAGKLTADSNKHTVRFADATVYEQAKSYLAQLKRS